MVFFILDYNGLCRVVESRTGRSLHKGRSRRFDHFTIIYYLVDKCFSLVGRGVESILANFTDKLLGRSVIGVYKGFTSRHYNDQLI